MSKPNDNKPPTPKGDDDTKSGWTVTYQPRYVVLQKDKVVDFNRGEVDNLLGFDFVDPGPSYINFGTERKLSEIDSKRILDSIYQLFPITGNTAQQNNQRSLILISVLKYYAENGCSSRLETRGFVILGETRVNMSEIHQRLGELPRRFCRYFGQFYYEYMKYKSEPFPTNWGRKWGIPDSYFWLHADFLDSVDFHSRMDNDIYAAASRRARAASKSAAVMLEARSGKSGEIRLTDENFRD